MLGRAVACVLLCASLGTCQTPPAVGGDSEHGDVAIARQELLPNEAPVEYQLKAVESIFCQGLSGECAEVKSFDELKAEEAEQLRVAKLEAQRIAVENARREKFEAERAANRTRLAYLPIFGRPKDYLPGELRTTEHKRFPKPRASTTRSGVQEGSPHPDARLPAFYPRGFGRLLNETEAIAFDAAQEAMEHESKAIKSRKPKITANAFAARLWQTRTNRFPHQREENHVSVLPNSLAGADAPEAEGGSQSSQEGQQSNLVFHHEFLQSLAAALPRNSSRARGDLDEDSASQFPPAPVLAKSPPVTTHSAHAGEVHHYTGLSSDDPAFDLGQPGVDSFDHIPRASHCPYRFSYKCSDRNWAAPPPAPPAPEGGNVPPAVAVAAATAAMIEAPKSDSTQRSSDEDNNNNKDATTLPPADNVAEDDGDVIEDRGEYEPVEQPSDEERGVKVVLGKSGTVFAEDGEDQPARDVRVVPPDTW